MEANVCANAKGYGPTAVVDHNGVGGFWQRVVSDGFVSSWRVGRRYRLFCYFVTAFFSLLPHQSAISLPARPPTAYTFHGIVSCAESRTVKCHATGTYGPFLAATRDRSVQQLLAGMSRSTAALVFHAATFIMVVLPLVDAAAHVYIYDTHADIAEIFPMASRELGRIAEVARCLAASSIANMMHDQRH